MLARAFFPREHKQDETIKTDEDIVKFSDAFWGRVSSAAFIASNEGLFIMENNNNNFMQSFGIVEQTTAQVLKR